MVEDLDLYILTYNDKVHQIDDNYKVIQCGKAISDINSDFIGDDTGDNISYKNEYYVETTGIYWIWKNTKSKYVGNMQYRRYLSINPLYIKNILSNGYDIILPNPVTVNEYSLEFLYDVNHNINDILEIKKIISEKFPEYTNSYDKYIKNGHTLFYSNSFVTSRKIYDDLCNFCFSILFDFEKRFNLSNREDRLRHAKEALNRYFQFKEVSHPGEDHVLYQSRVCGYLFERLLTLYIFHNKLNVYICGDYIKMEENMKI